MPGLRLLLTANDSANLPQAFTKCIHLDKSDDGAPLCKLLVDSVAAGVLDPVRKNLVPCLPSAKLTDQPEVVKALMCSYNEPSSAKPLYVALLAPERGPAFVLPRDGAPSASRVHISLAGAGENLVVVSRGPDPYAVMLDAVKVLGEAPGMSASDVHAYALPLLDGANRQRFDAALASAKSNGTKSAAGGPTAHAYEHQLHEGILVQAGPDCPAKPLLQAPGLRLCPGMSSALGVRYSGMSIVYGSATGHVLAVMDTPAALKMAPASSIRASAPGTLLTSRCSGAGYALAGVDSPSAVSAGVSDTSANTSATPSPAISRANSCGGVIGDSLSGDAAACLASAAPAGVAPHPPLVRVLSGRSITAAPIIQFVAATGPTHIAASSAVPAQRLATPMTPTGAPARVLASFALVGLKAGAGRDAAVRCCRIMPSSVLLSAANKDVGVVMPPAGAGASTPPLGVVLQLEVAASAAATLLMFVEGPHTEERMGGAHDEDDEDLGTQQPVQRVAIDGRSARWRYDVTGAMLSVEVPALTGPGARVVQVYL